MSSRKQRQHVQTTLRTIMEKGTSTAKDAGISAVEALRLEKERLIKRTGNVIKTGRQGRPSVEWRVTDKGRKRVKRAVNSGNLAIA